jgi:hypothetical protein
MQIVGNVIPRLLNHFLLPHSFLVNQVKN